MIKLKTAFTVIISTVLLMFLCTGFGAVAFAEEEAIPVQGEETVIEIEDLTEQFTDYLKDKYGEDYGFYYDKIISEWGSIEGYLLLFGSKLPEEYQSGWDKFVGWLKKYAPVWAVPLAVILAIITVLVGRKILNGTIDRIVNTKLKPVIKELNLQSNATVSIMHAQKALLGQATKFEDNVKELEIAEKELKDG